MELYNNSITCWICYGELKLLSDLSDADKNYSLVRYLPHIVLTFYCLQLKLYL